MSEPLYICIERSLDSFRSVTPQEIVEAAMKYPEEVLEKLIEKVRELDKAKGWLEYESVGFRFALGFMAIVESGGGKVACFEITPDDLKGFDYMRDVGLPGEYPYTRGVYPGMYRKAKWGLRQYSGFGTPKDTNERWKFLISSGQIATNLAFDLPTHEGLDSDDPLAEDEVGRVGVSIDSLRDIEILWDGLPMNMIPASYNTVGPAPVILAMLYGAWIGVTVLFSAILSGALF